MSDDIDRAQREVDRLVNEAQRVRKPAGPPPTGRCLYCDEVVADDHRWCDAHCRDNWEREHVRG